MTALPPSSTTTTTTTTSTTPTTPTRTATTATTTSSGTTLEDVGTILGEYPCVYENVNGVLYAGSKALYFVGKYFLFDKKLKLPWENIRQVVKLDHGVQIYTKQKEEIITFSLMHHSERVWPLLVSLHNDALLDRPTTTMTASNSHSPVLLKRTNSDPTLQSVRSSTNDQELVSPKVVSNNNNNNNNNTLNDPTIPNFVVEGLSKDEVGKMLGILKIRPISCTHDNVKGNLYGGNKGLYFYGKRFFDVRRVSFSFGSMKQIKILQQQGICVTTKEGMQYEFLKMENPDQTWASLIAIHNEILTETDHQKTKQQQRHYKRINSDPEYLLQRPSPEVVPTSLIFEEDGPDDNKEKATITTPEEDLHKQWAEIVAKKRDYPLSIVQDMSLKCSLDQFFDRFLADEAEFSMAKYMQSRGDSQIVTSHWKSQDDDRIQTRIIHYRHPVNAPLAPPQAGARKEQTLSRFGNLGLCLETRTIVDDVPMCDCFHVDDRIRIQRSPQQNDVTTISIEFQITFVKSTLFKSIIAKTTHEEMHNFLKNLGEYISQAQGGGSPPPRVEPAPPIPQQQQQQQAPRLDISWAWIHPCLTVLGLLLQLYIILELKSLQPTCVCPQT